MISPRLSAIYIPYFNTLPLIPSVKSYENLQRKGRVRTSDIILTYCQQGEEKRSYATGLEYPIRLSGYTVSVQGLHIASGAYRQYTIEVLRRARKIRL